MLKQLTNYHVLHGRAQNFLLFYVPLIDSKVSINQWHYIKEKKAMNSARMAITHLIVCHCFSFSIAPNVTANFRFGILFQNGELFMITKNLGTRQFASVK